MTRTFSALLLAALVFSGHAGGAEGCYYSDGTQNLYLLADTTDVGISPNKGLPPYACSTSSGGTGAAGRVAHCTDGFEGALVYNEDGSITFRGTRWLPTCKDNDAVLDLMSN